MRSPSAWAYLGDAPSVTLFMLSVLADHRMWAGISWGLQEEWLPQFVYPGDCHLLSGSTSLHQRGPLPEDGLCALFFLCSPWCSDGRSMKATCIVSLETLFLFSLNISLFLLRLKWPQLCPPKANSCAMLIDPISLQVLILKELHSDKKKKAERIEQRILVYSFQTPRC